MDPEPTWESYWPLPIAVTATPLAAVTMLFDEALAPSMYASTSLVTVFDEVAPAPSKATPGAIVIDAAAARLWAEPTDSFCDFTVTPPAEVIVEPTEYALSGFCERVRGQADADRKCSSSDGTECTREGGRRDALAVPEVSSSADSADVSTGHRS